MSPATGIAPCWLQQMQQVCMHPHIWHHLQQTVVLLDSSVQPRNGWLHDWGAACCPAESTNQNLSHEQLLS